jgi:hypothetical protein
MPDFAYVVGLIILGGVVVYAIRRQAVDTVSVPGGKIKFRAPANDQSLPFTISYESSQAQTQEGHARVSVNGQVFDLSISQHQPYQTVSTTVPAPGVYSYRIEQSEVQLVMPVGSPTGYLAPMRFT